VVGGAPENAGERFGLMASFLAIDAPASSALARELPGWAPTHPDLSDDLDQGHYFTNEGDALAMGGRRSPTIYTSVCDTR
jgi:hypothetical protein